VLVNIRELTQKDAQDIAQLMNHNISNYLYDIPDPYSVQDALNFIKTAHNDFKCLKGLILQ
jgi:hypothetical protein